MTSKEVVTVTCDSCDADLTRKDGGRNTYRLALAWEALRNESSARFAIEDRPPFSGTRHFCDMACLSKFQRHPD